MCPAAWIACLVSMQCSSCLFMSFSEGRYIEVSDRVLWAKLLSFYISLSFSPSLAHSYSDRHTLLNSPDPQSQSFPHFVCEYMSWWSCMPVCNGRTPRGSLSYGLYIRPSHCYSRTALYLIKTTTAFSQASVYVPLSDLFVGLKKCFCTARNQDRPKMMFLNSQFIHCSKAV